jgi:hypothetical protein
MVELTSPPNLNQERIQILTHCDPRRAVRAGMLADSVPPQIEVLCAVNGTADQIGARFGSSAIPKHLRFLPSPPQAVYPANALRNLALSRATAEWIFYVDCDFVFCRDFWGKFAINRFRSLLDLTDLICLCPIALWDPNGDYLATARSPHLLHSESGGAHRPPADWSEAAHAKLFKYHSRYFTREFGPGIEPYEMTGHMQSLRRSYTPAEPWGLIKRKHLPWADEEFRAGPMDKHTAVLLNYLPGE